MTKGIVRQIDNLGRLTLPMEYRKMLGLNIGDKMDMSVVDNKIVVSKYQTAEEKLNTLKSLFDELKEEINEDTLIFLLAGDE